MVETDAYENDMYRPFRRYYEYRNELGIYAALEERQQDGVWQNFSRGFFHKNEAGQDTLIVVEDWVLDNWQASFRQESTFSEGNLQNRRTFNRDDLILEDLYLEQENNYEYNTQNQRILESLFYYDVFGAVSYGYEGIYRYNATGRLDTLIESNYDTDIEDFDVSGISLFQYVDDQLGEDSLTVRTDFSFSSSGEIEVSVNSRFAGPGIYSGLPDSSFVDIVSLEDASVMRIEENYNTYYELGNNKIYLKQERFEYDTDLELWYRRSLQEEWYSIVMPSSADEVEAPTAQPAFVFPNPCRVGEVASVRIAESDTKREIVTFDLNGRMLTTAPAQSGGTWVAPNTPGLYTLLLVTDGTPTAVMKVVVGE